MPSACVMDGPKTSQIPPRGRVAARCYQREAPHARGVLKFSTYCYTNSIASNGTDEHVTRFVERRRDATQAQHNWEWRHRHPPTQPTHSKPTAAAEPIGTRHTETRHVTNVGRTASRVSQTSRRRRDREWRHRQWRHRSHRKCQRTRAYISHRRNQRSTATREQRT